jgi:hypothetical protein
LAGCAADEPGADTREEPNAPLSEDEPAEAATQSIDDGDEEASASDNDKALREKRCCVVKNYACDVNEPWAADICQAQGGNAEVTTYCNTMTGTQAGVRIACFGLGIGSSSRVVRDKSCGKHSDCDGKPGH